MMKWSNGIEKDKGMPGKGQIDQDNVSMAFTCSFDNIVTCWVY